jgi:hypothetical protein
MGLYDQYLAESDSGETGSDTEPETQYARYLRKKKEEDTARSDAAKPAPGSVRSLLQPLPGAQEPEAVTGPTPVSSAPWMISGRSSGTAQSLPATRVPAAHRGPVMAPTDALNAYDDTPSFEKRLAEARDRDPDAALRDLRRPSPEDEGRIAPRFANKLVGVANLAYTGVRALGHAVAPLAQGMAEFFPDVGIAGAQAAMGNTQPAKDLIRGTTLRPIEQALELGNAAKNRLFGDVPTDFRQKPAIGGGSYTEGALRNYDVGALHVRGDLTGPEAVQNAIDVYFAKGLVEHGLSSPANWIDRRAAFRVKADAAYQAPIDRAYDRAQPAIEGKKLWADEEAGNARSADAAQAYSVTPDGIRATRQLGSGYYEMPSVQEPITDPARVLPARAASLEQPSEINNRFRSTTGPRVDQPAIPMRAPWETITDPRRQLPAVAEGAAAPSQLNNRFGSVSGALQGPAIPLPARMPEATIGVDPPRAGEYATPEQVAQYPARREQGTALKTDLEMIQDARQQRFARAKEEADGDVALAKQSAEDEARAAAPRVRDAKTGLPKKSLQHVADTHIQEELNKLQYEHSTEENAMVAREEDPRWAQVQDLPSTESVGKLGRKAQEAGNEALPDGDGMYDPDELAKLRAEDREYKGNYMVREARLKLMKRLQGELDQRWQTGTQKLLPGETRETQGRGDDTDFDFGANVEDKNGGNENGSNRRGNSRVGVTAALGVGAAGGALGYAAAPNDKKIAGAIGGFAAGAALGIGAVRGAEALGDHLARGGDLAASRFGPDGEVAAGARRPGAIAPLSEDAIRVEAFRQKMQGIIADHAKQTRLSLEGRTGEPTVESTREPWETPQPERFSNRTGAVGDLSEKGTGSPLGSNRKRAPVAGAEDPTAMPPEPAMSGTHNLDYRKLMGAHELGGFPAPSIAVKPHGQAFTKFGEISLIAKRAAFDPALEPVFNSDIYSKRAPDTAYPRAKSKAVNSFLKPLESHYKDAGVPGELSQMDDRLNYGDVDAVEQNLKGSQGSKLAWLRENGENVEIPKVKPYRRFGYATDSKAFEKLLAGYGEPPLHVDEGSDYHKAMTEATKDAIREYVDALPKENARGEAMSGENGVLHQDMLDRVIGDDGLLTPNYRDQIASEVRHRNDMEVDRGALSQRLDDMIGSRKDQFGEWVEDKLAPFRENKTLTTVNGKKMAFTLENATKGSLSGDDPGAGLGSMRAALASRFRDLNSMRKASEQGIRPPAEVEVNNQKVGEQVNAVDSALRAHFKGPEWNSRTDYPGRMAIVDAILDAKKQPVDAVHVTRALGRNGFDVANVPVELVDQTVAAANAFKDNAVAYYEGKPQRAVTFDEIAGAVVPSRQYAKDVRGYTDRQYDRMRDVIDRRGIPVREYEFGKNDSNSGDPAKWRENVTSGFREELHKQGHRTLGKTRLPVTAAITGAGVGGAIGAAKDKDHPIRGAIVGAAGGAFLGGAGLSS